MPALTFLQMQSELTTLRFGEGKRSNTKLWLNQRYQQLFNLRDWPFRQVSREPVTMANGGFTTLTPFRRIVAVELSDGSSLPYMTPSDMRLSYPTNSTQAPPPQNYTTLNGVVKVAPAADVPAFCSYQRAVCHYDEQGTVVAGGFALDYDYPLWPEEHHYLLILGAMATGLKNVNDPTWQSVEQEYQGAVDQMIDDLMPPDLYGTLQYGRDDL